MFVYEEKSSMISVQITRGTSKSAGYACGISKQLDISLENECTINDIMDLFYTVRSETPGSRILNQHKVSNPKFVLD